VVDKKANKAKTKGKFIENVAQGADTNFVRDKKWLHKSNPAASQAEK
jgi:hypothetical protein